jgi:hypothetical protein
MATFSCKKEDEKNTHLDGKVVDGSTGVSISNAIIILRDDNEGLEIGTTTSDSNGNYNFDIKGEHSALSMKVTYTDFYTSPFGKDFQLSLDNTFEKRNFNLDIYPPAYVKLIAVKTDTVYDFVTFIYSENTMSGSAGITVYNSMPTNFSYKKMKGGYTTAFSYNIQKFLTGNPTEYASGAANIYCTPRDTTDFYLTY